MPTSHYYNTSDRRQQSLPINDGKRASSPPRFTLLKMEKLTETIFKLFGPKNAGAILESLAECMKSSLFNVCRRFSSYYQGQLVNPYGQVEATPFHLAHQGGPDLDLMSSLAGVYDAVAPSLRYTSPHCHRRGEDGAEGSRGEERLGTPMRIGT